MNYIKLLNTLGKLVKEGQIKSIDEAIQMVQKMGAKVDGLLKQGIENLFKTTKARDPDAFKGWTPEVIEGGKGKEGVENLFKETKRVNMPAEKLNHQMIADQAGIEVELIKGKDWVEILEVLKGLKKADGGRIGFKKGGRGRMDQMGGKPGLTAAEMRAVDPAQYGGGMNISHGGGDGQKFVNTTNIPETVHKKIIDKFYVPPIDKHKEFFDNLKKYQTLNKDRLGLNYFYDE